MGMGGGGERGEVQSDINVTPMADVMLVLLIIFMVVTPMLQKGVTVELARTENPVDMQEADREDSVIISITRDGNFYLNAEQVSVESIGAEVTEILADRLDKTVYVKSDFRTTYGNVTDVVDSVRAAGVDRIGLLTERLDSSVEAQ
jgi:biopolymer transport protein ExbD/biopolymer transport protein TolR